MRDFFETIRDELIAILQKDLLQLKEIALPEKRSIPVLNPTDPIFRETPSRIRAKLGLPPCGNQVMYAFKFIGQFRTEMEFRELIKESKSVKRDFSDGHTQVTGVKMPNQEFNSNSIGDVTLYVGTSKDFAKRLREHIGYGSKGTATLLLRNWPSLSSRRIHTSLIYYDFGPSISSDLVKLFEHELSSRCLRPLAGHNRRA